MRLAIIIIATCLVAGGCATPSPPPAFAIYSVSDEEAFNRELQEYAVDPKPLLTDKDLIAYEWASHTLTLQPGVRNRFFYTDSERKTRFFWGMQFIVAANGHRCYSGYTVSPLSSTSSGGVCIIGPDPFSEPTNRVRLSLGYPASWAHDGPDPRGDPRIKAALEKVGKLK